MDPTYQLQEKMSVRRTIETFASSTDLSLPPPSSQPPRKTKPSDGVVAGRGGFLRKILNGWHLFLEHEVLAVLCPTATGNKEE